MRIAIALAILLPLPAFAQPKFAFEEGKHGAGELKIVQGLPRLVVAGKPGEIGEQLGKLIGKGSPNPTPVLNEFLADVGMKDSFPALQKVAGNLKANFPEAYETELQAFAKGAEYDPDMLHFVNSVYDLSSGLGCATVIVEKDRSATGETLFGRNFDWVPSKGLPEQTLLLVMKPSGKHAFVSITFAPITGVISGMNAKGLCATINQIDLKQAKDKSAFNLKGTPMLMIFRQLLEECATIDEIETFLKKSKPMTTASLSTCDEAGGAVFEITPKSIEKRTATKGVALCTNKFVSAKLDGDAKKCWRLEKLEKIQSTDAKLGVDDVFAKLHEVNQKEKTLQTMVFEPKTRTIHLKIGEGKGKDSASRGKAVTLEFADVFK